MTEILEACQMIMPPVNCQTCCPTLCLLALLDVCMFNAWALTENAVTMLLHYVERMNWKD